MRLRRPCEHEQYDAHLARYPVGGGPVAEGLGLFVERECPGGEFLVDAETKIIEWCIEHDDCRGWSAYNTKWAECAKKREWSAPGDCRFVQMELVPAEPNKL